MQNENLRRLENRLYRGQADSDLHPELANTRYQLLPGDFSRIYRRLYRQQGINIDNKPELNVDGWFNPDSPSYNASLAEAVFYYSARGDKHERFELYISTPEMKSAAWNYVHNKQLILDGTFGLCTSRLLMWIAMGVDGNNHGVPVAIFLFSAPSGAKATHAGYDTKIIHKLLQSWASSQGSNDCGEAFGPHVCITDCDTKERAALVLVWPRIILLLCKFHLRQCWTNKRDALFGKGNTDYYKTTAVTHLRAFEER